MDGMTLVELLVVLGVVAILAGVILSTYTKAKDAARKVLCENYKRQLIIFYHTTEFEVEETSPSYTIRPLMEASRVGAECYRCHAGVP